ncbi:MAG: hypothetical protein ACJAZP_004074, partial [Psychromonas sp.]
NTSIPDKHTVIIMIKRVLIESNCIVANIV